MPAPVTGKIHVLPDEVSCRIAAGEVVERPASVVKELIDNSLDAESTLITIEVEDGGRRLIRVTDNGMGMNRNDAQLACQRFATSKLQTEDDLFRLTTLGFRGEALPSIASVSRVYLNTVPTGSQIGTQTHSEGGTSWDSQDYAGASGTQVEVHDLFFNTPGRLKFLKTISTEFSKISYTVQQAAAINPHVHFRLFHHNHKILDYPKVAKFQDRFMQMYGPTFLDRFLPLTQTEGPFQLNGFIISPHHTRTSRTPQEIFVNGRPIKNTTITHAIYEGYGSFLPKGKHPHFILCIQLDSQTLDINVHPTKREVRFSHPEVVHSGILRTIKQTFARDSSFTIDSSAQEEANVSFQSPTTTTRITKPSLAVAPVATTRFSPEMGGARGTHLSLFAQEPSSTYTVRPKDFHIVPLGQIQQTYLVGHINEDLYIIDQHTAHERVLFERLLQTWSQKDVQQQALLIPEPIDLLPHQGTLLEEWLPVLSQTGLDIERFGPTSFVVRSIPAILGTVAIGPLILELVEELSEWKSTDSLDALIRPILASMACQSAVQAGRTMALPEISTLLHDWAHEHFPMTCPHGRRVAIRHSVDELNTLFARTSENHATT
ncbi:MAG: DNA mismatch repair endonuclease MutL [Nitrospirota bacterium]|nr:DNA mismatch repair endonuclease MutL [Nitrospirota bacterium]